MKNIILASGSPRRKELLSQLGFEFQVIPSNKEEVITKDIPEEIVKELAYQKAKDVYDAHQEADIVIGSDTIVAIGNTIMGKPKDEEDAFNMIKKLQNNTHIVFTGVSILSKEKELLFAQGTEVVIYPMTDKQILEYIATKEPMDKAGAYAIQGIFSKYVKEIHGDYNTVVGFPLSRVYQELISNKLI